MKSEIKSELLDEIQLDLPLTPRPFATIGERCGISEQEVLRGLEAMVHDNFIREISALINPRKLGFVSSLVAVSTPAELESTVAEVISGHPRVSHNYHRDSQFNIWFTIAAESTKALADEVASLHEGFPEVEWALMPAIKTYKLRVNLAISNGKKHKPESPQPTTHRTESKVDLMEKERKLLSRLERPFPVTVFPWRKIGEDTKFKEAEVLKMVTRLKQNGVIRRIAGVLRHRNIGFTANGMACFSVQADTMDQAGNAAAARPEVSHCYWRETPESWKHQLFAMIHAKTESECITTANSIAEEIRCDDHKVLFSTIEYKKERVKYFGGPE